MKKIVIRSGAGISAESGISTFRDGGGGLWDNYDTKEGKDQISRTKVRIGQAYYLKIIITLYAGKCCVTGLDVPKLLRTSHIIGWAEDKNNRMNPKTDCA